MFYSHHRTLSLKDFLIILNNYLKKKDTREIFQSRLESYFPSRSIIDFNLARNAFDYIVQAKEIKRILMPAFLCSVFEEILINRGVKPLFVDIDINTLNLDIEKVQEALGKEVDAILAVHTFGSPCELSALKDLSEDHRAILIEDCAHSLGAKYRGSPTGTFGDFAIFSIYKALPSTGGGFLVAKERLGETGYEEEEFDFHKLLRLLYAVKPFHPLAYKLKNSFKGKRVVQESSIMKKKPLKRASQLDITIFNYFFHNIEDQVRRKNEMVEVYEKYISKEILTQKISKESRASRQSYPIVLEGEKRDSFLGNLRSMGIMGEKTWFDPIIFSPRLREKYNIDPANYKNAVRAAEGIVTLPVQPDYSRKDASTIARAVNQLLG